MAKRNADDGGMNLDSLLDTLTNVVGILLIILIFTVLNGADAVRRIKGFVDQISEAQLQQALAQSRLLHEALEKHQDYLGKLEDEAPRERASLEAYQKLIAELNQDLETLASAKVDAAQLTKEVDQRRVEAAAMEKDIEAKQKEIAGLKARLAEKPAQGPSPDAKIVNLPDPREAPKGAKPITFLCRKGRIVPVDAAALQAKAMEVTKAASRVAIKNDRVDAERLGDIFEKRFVGDRYCQLKLRTGGDARPYLAVEPRPDAGEAAEAIAKRTSQFHRWIQGIDPSRFYLEFRVFGDSFDEYLAARNAAARQGLSAGWTPYDAKAEYWIGFDPDFKLLVLGKEPPKPKPAQPPADPDRSPPPPDVVD